jgi:transposase InsO family protein
MPLQEMTIVDVREQMALRALEERYALSEVAEMFGVSRPTVRMWRDRYREGGRRCLEDRSHAAHTCPHRTSEAIEELIIAERERWGWGSKKILSRLEEAHPQLELPKRATVDAILSRHNLVDRRTRGKRRQKTPFVRRYEATEPGELTTIDHKGQFRLGNGRYCHPLTMADSVSRFLLACDALDSTSFDPAWRVVQRVFRKHGLPWAMQSDNGPPFGPTHGRFSIMSVRLMTLDVQPVFSRPGRPGDNGRHERMHRDLKAATTRPPSQTPGQQQKQFDLFRKTYNEDRPHEGIDMQRPARLYKVSPRPFPPKVPKPEYPGHFEKRKVHSNGQISWHDRAIFISQSFGGQTVGLEPTDDGIWTVHFYRFTIGKVDERKNDFL